MVMSKGDFEFDIADFISGCQKIEKKFSPQNYSQLTMLFSEIGKKMETWAKQNRPWTDRTSRARGGLKGYAQWEGSSQISAYIAHTVEYGIYLELCNQGRYAVLEPTLNEIGTSQEVNDAIKTLLQGIVR